MDSASIIEGDIIQCLQCTSSEDDNISDEAQDAYVSRNSSLWRKGMVAYKFEKYHGGNLYKDEDMRFIKDAMNQITEQVPCIVFK